MGYIGSETAKAALLLSLCMGPAAASAQDLVLARDQHFVDAVVNGTTLRLKVRLDHERSITLNPAAAARAGLGRGDDDIRMRIGPIQVPGRTASPPVFIGGKPVPTPVTWYERDVASEADGTIGVDAFESITLETGTPSGEGRAITLLTRVNREHGLHVPVRVNRRNIAVRFSLDRPRSWALAAAAAPLAAALGGRLEDARVEVDVSFGIVRPARLMRLGRPLAIGSFSLGALLVRSADFRGRNRLPYVQQAVDPNAVIVTGSASSQGSVYRITVGEDVIGGCWSVTYRRADEQLFFRCPG